MLDRAYTDAEIEAAVEALSDPARLKTAQDLVATHAPQLQRILDEALAAGGWFGAAHEQALLQAAGKADVEERLTAVRTLLADETRIGMFVGVAVGVGLAQELSAAPPPDERTDDT